MKLNQKTKFISNICCFKFNRARIVNIVYKNFLLKKVLNIVYKFSNNHYKILFLGIDKQYAGFLKFLKLKTQHIFIPTFFWLNGVLSNKLIIKNLYFKKQFNCLIDLKLKHDLNLIIMLNKFKHRNEIFKSNLLSITFCNNSITYSNFYNVSSNIQNSIFLLLIYLVFKKFN